MMDELLGNQQVTIREPTVTLQQPVRGDVSKATRRAAPSPDGIAGSHQLKLCFAPPIGQLARFSINSNWSSSQTRSCFTTSGEAGAL